MDRRDFVKRGALWTLGALVLGPEAVDRLTWKRRYFPSAWAGPRTWRCETGAQFQHAVNYCHGGDTIELLEGVVYSPVVLPKRTDTTGFVHIQCAAGHHARLTGYNEPPIQCAAGAHHWHILGLRIDTVGHDVRSVQVPDSREPCHHITIERCDFRRIFQERLT